MEAGDEPQHRTKVKPRKAGLVWVSVPVNTTPDIQPRQDGNEDGSGGTLLTLTQGDLRGSAQAVGGKEADDDQPRPSTGVFQTTFSVALQVSGSVARASRARATALPPTRSVS